MAVCQDCDREMTEAASCTVDALIIRDERFPREMAVEPLGPNGRCGDCGVQRDGYHHLGCDLEPCPRCGWQLISCACGSLDSGHEAIVAVANGVVVYPPALRGLHVPDVRFPFHGGLASAGDDVPRCG